MANELVFGLLVLAQVLDLITTWIGIAGGKKEKNPAPRWLMAKMGTTGGLLTAKGLAIAAVAAVYFSGALRLWAVQLFFIAVLVFYAIVIRNNLKILRR